MKKLFMKEKGLPAKTGNVGIDTALAQHRTLDGQVRQLKKSVQKYLDGLRQTSDASADVTHAFRTALIGTGSEKLCDAFAAVHEKVDEEIPQRLLQLAHDIILVPLANFVKDLDSMVPELKRCQEKEASLNHYTNKMSKLENQGITLPKEEQRYIRNKKKLKEASLERNAIVDSCSEALERIYESKEKRLKPVLKALYQFQQQWALQTSKTLDKDIFSVSLAQDNQVNVTVVEPPSAAPLKDTPLSTSTVPVSPIRPTAPVNDQDNTCDLPEKFAEANISGFDDSFRTAYSPNSDENTPNASLKASPYYAGAVSFRDKTTKDKDRGASPLKQKSKSMDLRLQAEDPLVDKWFGEFNGN